MLATILTWLGSGFGASIIKGALSAYTAKLNANTSERTLTEQLAERELAVQARELELQSMERIQLMGHPLAVENLFAYVTLIFYGKVLLWDKVLAAITHGSTDEVYGTVGVWAGMIMTFYFGKRAAVSLLQLWKKGA